MAVLSRKCRASPPRDPQEDKDRETAKDEHATKSSVLVHSKRTSQQQRQRANSSGCPNQPCTPPASSTWFAVCVLPRHRPPVSSRWRLGCNPMASKSAAAWHSAGQREADQRQRQHHSYLRHNSTRDQPGRTTLFAHIYLCESQASYTWPRFFG